MYVFSLASLSTNGIDVGAIAGSYIGLFLLCAVYTAIGVFASGLQHNAVVSFLVSALLSYAMYALFSSLSGLDGLKNSTGYILSQLGVRAHYDNISKGFIDAKDLVYFTGLICLFLHFTVIRIKMR